MKWPRWRAQSQIELARIERLQYPADTLQNTTSPVAAQSIAELVEAGRVDGAERSLLSTLAFGTGGIRGRTIGKIVTAAERGHAERSGPAAIPLRRHERDEFHNVSRATQGLVALPARMVRARKVAGRPKIVIAHDTRFFSKRIRRARGRSGGGERLRCLHLRRAAFDAGAFFRGAYSAPAPGIVITASHNPPHDNGYKVYFDDGAQVVEPHASGIIAKVNAIASETTSRCRHERGQITTLGRGDRRSLHGASRDADPRSGDWSRAQSDLRIVFTPIHGTGGVIIKPMLERLGFNFDVVRGAGSIRWRFPTVKSPNPENAEALAARRSSWRKRRAPTS